MFASILSLAILTYCSPVTATSPSVTVNAGTLNGAQCNGSNAVFYKSIPYAKPPTGNLRFAPPEAFDGQYPGGSLDASKPAPACIQFGTEFVEKGPTSEDCLYLDVWVPASATPDSSLPVRVWVYGGTNYAGGISDPLYDGCNVAANGVVHVSLNYRLGPLGFLALPSASIQGNQAIQDLLLGLQWVQDNIRAFGGDPNKVMLHGQSAGAVDTFTLATLPQASQLFGSAIFESGAGRDTLLADTAQAIGQAYARALNCSFSDASCLQSKSLDDLGNVFESLPITHSGPGHPDNGFGVNTASVAVFAPYVDGKIIPKQTSTTGVQVPSVFGFTSRDGALFVAASFQNPANITEQDYIAFLDDNWDPTSAALILKYIPFSTFNTTSAPGFAAIEYVYTAWQYQCPVYRGANTAAAHGVPAWVYDFAHTPSCAWVPSLPQKEVALLGPTHTSELPFVFGNINGLPLPNGTCNLTPEESTLSKFMVNAWNAMAANQAPADNATWPAWSGPGSSLGLTFTNSTVPGPIDFKVCELFDQIDAIQLANATATNNGTAGTSGTTGANVTGTGSLPSSTIPVSSGVGVSFGATTSWLVVGGAMAALMLSLL